MPALPEGIKRVNGRYQARTEVGGRDRQRTYDHLDDAKAFLTRIKNDHFQGYHPDPMGPRTRFSVLAEDWLTHRLHQPQTNRTVASNLRHQILPFFGDRRVGDITPDDVRVWVTGRERSGLSHETLGNCLGHLSSIMATAVERDWIRRSPTTNIRLPEAPSKDPVLLLTAPQVVALTEVIAPYLRFTVLACALTGVRPGEVLGLTTEESVPFPHHTLHVIQQLRSEPGYGQVLAPTKTPAGKRGIPMPEELTYALASHLQQFGREVTLYVQRQRHGPWTQETRRFVTTTPKGEPVSYDSFNRRFKTAVRRAGLPLEVSPKSLRHFYDSLLVDSGANIAEVQEYMGHRKGSTTTLAVYTHVTPESGPRTRSVVGAAWRSRLEPGSGAGTGSEIRDLAGTFGDASENNRRWEGVSPSSDGIARE